MLHSKKPILQALYGHSCSSPPLWMMRQAGRYLPEYRKIRQQAGSFLTLCYTPALAVEVTLQPIRRFGCDAAILFSDILVIPDALGNNVTFKEGEGPVVAPIREEKDLQRLKIENVLSHLAPVYEAVSSISAKLPTTTALIGFAGSPWTVATYMIEGRSSRDFILAKTMAYSSPELLSRLISILTEATILHIDAQIRAGAEVIQLFDSWSGILAEDEFTRFVIEPTKKIVDSIHILHPNVPIIGFPKGAGIEYERYATKTGINGLSIDQYMPLSWVNSHIPNTITLQGCLDPLLLLGNNTTLIERTTKICTAFRNRPFIYNLGHGILPETPIENVEIMINTVRNL